ncbi:FMN-binding glutamate synthase family protein [Peredibacter sp. HCB2-198]|uniref:FMN-binding glutamate synthase family protein n=1 Tax=Peredibacter sp. HCB2-198 TaxID=3383025 RepID=UPI0038B4DAD0
MRSLFWYASALALMFHAITFFISPYLLLLCLLTVPLFVIGIIDMKQTKHSIRRNFPVIGHMRYLLEMIRPEINQYFIESNTDGTPFSREERSVVYQRSKKVTDTIPFGTQRNVYEEGYEYVPHSMSPVHVDPKSLRVSIGGKDCKKPYLASIFNISAMSYGSLSKNAVLALNGGAKDGAFAHNTGEGGISPYHLENGGDLIWQIGTGYFGCRDDQGNFNPSLFAERASDDRVKMIEIKLSQGAKPGHGGILPKEKLTPEISKIRSVPMGKDVISPPGHSAFTTPKELCLFIQKLRDFSGGKPVGIKLSIGRESEFFAFCKAMLETGITPDYISIDGSEGGTGAAPLEFSNSVGMPGQDAILFVVNTLRGLNLKKDIKVLASGKLTSAFGIIRLLSMGVDVCYAARPFMLSLGCIQALRCNTNDCPTGVATQDPHLVGGLVVTNKRKRVKNFHEQTIKGVAEILGAMGVSDHHDLTPHHLRRRVSQLDVRPLSDMIPWVEEGSYLKGEIPSNWKHAFEAASPESFRLDKAKTISLQLS